LTLACYWSSANSPILETYPRMKMMQLIERSAYQNCISRKYAITIADWLIFHLYRSQKTWDRYQQNYKHLLELVPGLKPLIASSKDLKKASELRKIVWKVSTCTYMHPSVLSDLDFRWNLLFQALALMTQRIWKYRFVTMWLQIQQSKPWFPLSMMAVVDAHIWV
jgi:hypothetical protein